MESRCQGCGLEIEGGTAACHAIFEELLARDFGDVAYFRMHRMLVDVYALQHPDRYCVSAKSLAAHLAGLGWLLEQGGSRAVGDERLRRWLDGRAAIEKPALPAGRGALTIAHARGSGDPGAYARALEEWARATWDAYAPLHAVAREWIRQALARKPPAIRASLRDRASGRPPDGG